MGTLERMLLALTPLTQCHVRLQHGGHVEVSAPAADDRLHIHLQMYDDADGGDWRHTVLPFTAVRPDPAMRTAAEIRVRRIASEVLSRYPEVPGPRFFTHGQILWIARVWPDVPCAIWTEALNAVRRSASLYDLCAMAIHTHNAFSSAEGDD